LIPHFFIGLYMYTNSSILTPWKFGESKIYKKIFFSSNEYFNSDRFVNIHSMIFFAAIAFFLLLLIFRYILYALLRTMLDKCCRNLKDRF
jgi:hypothetical protein